MPAPESVRIYGRGKSRSVRILARERCSLDEITASLQITRDMALQALRWKGALRVWGGA
jgi:hypothetical protein